MTVLNARRILALMQVDGTRLRFSVVSTNPAPRRFVTRHIHSGAAGTNGSMLVSLFSGSSSAAFAQADSLTIGANTAAAICGDPAGHHVNYHTSQDPQGAVRGQLRWAERREPGGAALPPRDARPTRGAILIARYEACPSASAAEL